MGLQIRGTATELEHEDDIADCRTRLQEGHPDFFDFYDDLRIAFFRLVPTQRFIINFAWGFDWRQEVGPPNQPLTTPATPDRT